jgi:hypothetical protein
MSDLVTLGCPACGAPLHVMSDVSRLTCARCGADYAVRRSGRLVSLAAATDASQQAQQAADETASGLSIPGLKQEIEALRVQREKVPALSCLGAVGILVLLTIVGAVAAAALSLGLRAIIAADLLGAIALPAAWLLTHLIRDRRRAPIDEQIAHKEGQLAHHTRATGTSAIASPPQQGGPIPPRTKEQRVLLWIGVAAGSVAALAGLAGIVAGFVFLAVPPEQDYHGFSVLFAVAAFLVGLIALQVAVIGLYACLKDLLRKKKAR